MIFKSKPKDENVLEFKHRYKWKLEEISILVFLYAFAVTFITLGFMRDFNTGDFIAGGVFLVISLAVQYLGASRKHKSRLTATFDVKTTKLTVWGHNLKQMNHILVKDVAKVYVKKISKTDESLVDPKDVIILANSNSKQLIIPMRIAKQPGLIDIIEIAMAKSKVGDPVKVNKFLEAAKAWKG